MSVRSGLRYIGRSLDCGGVSDEGVSKTRSVWPGVDSVVAGIVSDSEAFSCGDRTDSESAICFHSVIFWIRLGFACEGRVNLSDNVVGRLSRDISSKRTPLIIDIYSPCSAGEMLHTKKVSVISGASRSPNL